MGFIDLNDFEIKSSLCAKNIDELRFAFSFFVAIFFLCVLSCFLDLELELFAG